MILELDFMQMSVPFQKKTGNMFPNGVTIFLMRK